jgi:hypothetical protein
MSRDGGAIVEAAYLVDHLGLGTLAFPVYGDFFAAMGAIVVSQLRDRDYL